MRVTELGLLRSASELEHPLVTFRIPCGVTGFPSPADDYQAERLDLNSLLIKHPAATYYARAEGNSMTGAGIFPDDILILDRSLDTISGRVIVAWLNGEYVVKRYHFEQRLGRAYLLSENPDYPPYEIPPDVDFAVWAVVTASVRLHLPL